MLVFACSDGFARVGHGGGIVRYESLDDIAGVTAAPVPVEMTVDRLSAALAGVGQPWWRRRLGRSATH